MRPCPRPVPLALPSSCILGHALRALLRREKYTQKKEPLFAWKTIVVIQGPAYFFAPCPPKHKVECEGRSGCVCMENVFSRISVPFAYLFQHCVGGMGVQR